MIEYGKNYKCYHKKKIGECVPLQYYIDYFNGLKADYTNVISAMDIESREYYFEYWEENVRTVKEIVEAYMNGPNGEPCVEDAHEFLLEIRENLQAYTTDPALKAEELAGKLAKLVELKHITWDILDSL